MTRQSYYQKGSPFSEWLRQQPEIDSRLGFVTTDIDYLWRNYQTGTFMLIEEKCRMGEMNYSQRTSLEFLDSVCSYHPLYKGFHLIQFENESPEDGDIYLDGKKITKEELISFLRFEQVM